MKKALSILALSLITGLYACDGGKPTPEPEPDEYFSFYADDEYINYPQVKGLGFTGEGQTLEAHKIGGTEYVISGRLKDAPDGLMSLYFPGGHIPDQDTFVLTEASIYDFRSSSNNFRIESPLTGKVIFTERSGSRLTGTFEFQAFKYHPETGELSDTIISITEGKFSIIPKS